MPLTVINFSKSCFFCWSQKSVEGDLIFADVGVDVQRDFAARAG